MTRLLTLITHALSPLLVLLTPKYGSTSPIRNLRVRPNCPPTARLPATARRRIALICTGDFTALGSPPPAA